jgi:hypothetical protein
MPGTGWWVALVWTMGGLVYPDNFRVVENFISAIMFTILDKDVVNINHHGLPFAHADQVDTVRPI